MDNKVLEAFLQKHQNDGKRLQLKKEAADLQAKALVAYKKGDDKAYFSAIENLQKLISAKYAPEPLRAAKIGELERMAESIAANISSARLLVLVDKDLFHDPKNPENLAALFERTGYRLERMGLAAVARSNAEAPAKAATGAR